MHLGLIDDDIAVDASVETPALHENGNRDIKIDETKLITTVEIIEDLPSILGRLSHVELMNLRANGRNTQ
eukprot:3465182-Pyramimonas_sp.AAC.1